MRKEKQKLRAIETVEKQNAIKPKTETIVYTKYLMLPHSEARQIESEC